MKHLRQPFAPPLEAPLRAFDAVLCSCNSTARPPIVAGPGSHAGDQCIQVNG